MKPVYSDPQKSDLNKKVVSLRRSKSIVQALLVFIERWSLDTDGLALRQVSLYNSLMDI